MIQIGKISLRGPVGPPRYSRFSADEARTHMTFWCIYRSPLMLGGNLPDNRAMEDSLFTNEEILAVNQHGEHPWQVYKNDSAMVWASGAGEGPVAGSIAGSVAGSVAGHKAYYVALFNIGPRENKIGIDLARLGIRGRVAVRDLWGRKDAGLFNRRYIQSIPPHGAALIRVVAQ